MPLQCSINLDHGVKLSATGCPHCDHKPAIFHTHTIPWHTAATKSRFRKPFQGRRSICSNGVLKHLERKRIIMHFLLIAAALICRTAAANSPCSSLYASYDLSPNFNETIAHSIHSMTVQGLRLFNPRATKDKRVPTVNHDIHDEVKLLVIILFLSFS